eukprot:259694-Chlamydomonas_euryale.AAC.4
MKSGGELFTRQANSVEDIGLAGQEARGMVDGIIQIAQPHAHVHMQHSSLKPLRSSPHMRRVQVRRRIDEKNKLLRAMAANSKDAQYAVVDMGEVNNQWEAFTTQLQQFDAHLEEQKVQLAGTIAKQLDDFRGRIGGFGSRWAELKPKQGPSGNPAVVLTRIEEFAAAINEFQEEAARLQKDAEMRGRSPYPPPAPLNPLHQLRTNGLLVTPSSLAPSCLSMLALPLI